SANINAAYLKNLSASFARPTHNDYAKYIGLKKVYMNPNRFFKKDNLELEFHLEFDKLVMEDEVPLLKLKFSFKEKPADRRDSLQVHGNGSTLLFPWGTVKDFKTTVKFRFKALGFNILKGVIKEELEYIQ
ncbi:hypothetical protein MJH12_17075, partial [bacterium]|nr:hypothetical protein [bacterium]